MDDGPSRKSYVFNAPIFSGAKRPNRFSWLGAAEPVKSWIPPGISTDERRIDKKRFAAELPLLLGIIYLEDRQ